MDTNQLFLDAWAIAQARTNVADLDEDGVSAVALAFVQEMLETKDAKKAAWKMHSAERNVNRKQWATVSTVDPNDEMFQALIEGALAALDDGNDCQLDLIAMANDAIRESEEAGDLERAFTLQEAREEYILTAGIFEPKRDDNGEIVPAPLWALNVPSGNDPDGVLARIGEAYDDDKIVKAAQAASSTSLGYTDEEDAATQWDLTMEDALSEEAESELPVYLQDQWPFDEMEVELATDKLDWEAGAMAGALRQIREANDMIRKGRQWLRGRKLSKEMQLKVQARFEELYAIVDGNQFIFNVAAGKAAEQADGLSPTEQASFAVAVARSAAESTANRPGYAFNKVRDVLAEVLDLDADDEEVFAKLYPQGQGEAAELHFSEEEQGLAILRVVGGIQESVSPASEDWRVWETKEWRQAETLRVLRGRESFAAIKDAVKASLKADGHYVHSGVKAAWRAHFQAEKQALFVTGLLKNGVVVGDGEHRRVWTWDRLGNKAANIRVQPEKRASFKAALEGIPGAEAVIGLLPW